MACKKKVTAVFLQCSECKGQAHKTKKECNGGMTRKQLERLKDWICPGCRGIDANPRAPAKPDDNPDFKIKSKNMQGQLKILQWNADSLLSKMEELRDFLESEKIDVFMIQETKLITTDPDPAFKGYTIVRQDRVQRVGCETNRGGGLITGIKEDINFREVSLDIIGEEDEITEWLTIELPTKDNEKLRLTNMYIPPPPSMKKKKKKKKKNWARPKKAIVTTDKWPVTQYDCLFGDFNAHSTLWSEEVEKGVVKENPRGTMIENWMSTVNMDCINDRSQLTRNGRITTTGVVVTDSSPDITFVHSSLLDRFSWESKNDLNSDHKPIIITYEDVLSIPKSESKPRYKWRLNQAKWDVFTSDLESKASGISGDDAELLEKHLREAILKTAGKHVGSKKLTDNPKPWLTPDIKKLITDRNTLRVNIASNRSEFRDISNKIRDSVREEKSKLWQEYVKTLDMSTNPTKVWQTIRSLDGRRKPPRKNEALVVDNVALIEDADKAEAFAKTYRGFSHLPTRKLDRKLKRQVRKRSKKTYKTSCDEPAEMPITIEELDKVIREAGNNKAAGPDRIPYEFIKHMGPIARSVLLKIYNLIWVEEQQLPRMWRNCDIIPQLKDGKDPALTASHRPISLSSCPGKLLEKIIADRMTYILEDRQLLTQNQAGFRPGRCTTDQILKLTQSATDQMQRRNLPKDETYATIIAFFDYEKAYDKVWRHGLLYKMQELGLPRKFIRYARSFLSGRITTVNVNNTRSHSFLLKEGLPQGSSISPLLFLIFINDIDVDIRDDSLASLFADDTSVWRNGGVLKGETRDLMQQEVDAVLRWAHTWKMSVNTDKTKTMIISSNPSESKYNPELKAGNDPVINTSTYKFLGPTIDDGMRFTEQVEKLILKCKKRNKILKSMAWKEWGSKLESLRTLYIQYTGTCMEYASSSWAPWIAPTNLEKLQVVQREALRAIVGLTKDCPKDFLYLEAGIEPLGERFNKIDEILWDKYLRLPQEDARHRLVTTPITEPRLTTRHGFRYRTHSRIDNTLCRAPICPPLPPWLIHDNLKIHYTPLTKPKSKYLKSELLRISMDCISTFQADINIYTDGSTNDNQENGGAGVYIESDGMEIARIIKPAGKYCASYGGEIVALLEAMKWIENSEKECQHQLTILIATDSKSLTDAMKHPDWKSSEYWMHETRKVISRISSCIHLLWIPSHCDTPGNDKADDLAKLGSEMSQEGVPITQDIIKAKIKSRPWTITHARALETFGERRIPRTDVEKTWPKPVRTLYAQLRSGHCMELKWYRHFINIEEDDLCEECSKPETIEHVLLDCSRTDALRQKFWGGKEEEDVNTSLLTSEPDTCRRILSSIFTELTIKESQNENLTLCSDSNRSGARLGAPSS